jgi:hypothetical protein
MGDQVDGEAAGVGQVFHAVDRQRHAIDHDRPLVGQVLAQGLGGIDDQLARFTHGLEGMYLSQAIDVAGDQVAAQALGQGQGFFQVDFAGGVQAGRQAQAFTGDIDGEAALALLDHGHAGAIEGDRIAQADIGHGQAARIDTQAHAGVRAGCQGMTEVMVPTAATIPVNMIQS